MRATYRAGGAREYWTARWENISADAPMENETVYPLKYAQITVADKSGTILEAGCGAGRILSYYHDRGYDVVGIGFIEGVINKLRGVDPTLQVEVDDITNLRFADHAFRYVPAYGLFRNLQEDLDRAARETSRVPAPGGKVCASFRADNIQIRLTDWLADPKSNNRADDAAALAFQKMNSRAPNFKTCLPGPDLPSNLSTKWKTCRYSTSSGRFVRQATRISTRPKAGRKAYRFGSDSGCRIY